MAELGWEAPVDRVLNELARLGRSAATGAAEISGRPGGIVYLNQGRLTFAESPGVPDLGTRLVRSGRLAPDVWDQIARESPPGSPAVPDGVAGAALAGRGIISAAELQRLLQSITLDALLALTTPFVGECSVRGLWFMTQRSHWAETVLAMDIGSVRDYIDHMAQRLAWYDVSPLWCPRWSGPGRPEALVNATQRAVASRMDGHTAVGELAWQGGLALHDTMDAVGQLVHAGHCAVPAPDPVLALAGAPADVPVLADARGTPDTPQPAHSALPHRAAPTGERAAHVAQVAQADPLDLALLQRVRQGLERMGPARSRLASPTGDGGRRCGAVCLGRSPRAIVDPGVHCGS